ncbi:hypothetical protein PHYPO_G00155140 [Pangasianodon hypophthalmus]|uniref:Ig-like domain-containing protein n=1 Tax=Pangasianodon hypophthalmus TaxID=310915 RepID=A0A5N5JXA5_PANHP|nr:hypothetical protein PHYPO_G00155140 [Pangasianodon hypophthalmus]
MTVVESQQDSRVHYTQQSICALKGSTVTMGCTYKYNVFFNAKRVFWSKKESTVATVNEPPDLSLDPEYRGRVQYIRETLHDCKLRLSNVTKQDQSIYFAIIIMTSGRKLEGRSGVNLSVTELQVDMVPDSVLEGDPVTFTCETTCRLTDTPTFTWYKSGSELYSIYNFGLLHLPAVSQEDSGSYSCAVKGQSYRSPAVILNVYYLPKSVSVSISPSGEIVEGSSVTLTCSSDANPPVHDYTWYKETSSIGTEQSYIIHRIRSEDSGDYKCKARNYYGEKYSDGATLNVLYPPKRVSVSISPSGEIVEGSSVTLICSSDAKPPVHDYTWYKGTSSIGSGQSYIINRIRSEDSGEYKCKARNRYGEKYSDGATLNVLYPPKRVSVSISPSGEIVEGSSVTLTCSSDAKPPVVSYTWFKGTSFIRTGQSYIINRIRSEDSGDYKCKARNRYGEKYSDGVTLNILYPPKSVSVSISPSGEIVEGSSVTLTCSSDAKPPVHDYTWYKGRFIVESGKTYTINKFSSMNSGQYMCKANNLYGEKYSDGVTLNVLDPPKRVSVSISPTGAIVEGSSVTLTCNSDDNSVKYTWFKGTSVIGTAKTYTISKISSKDSGEYKCKSSNQYGEKYSEEVTVKVLYPPKRVSVSISPSGEIVEGSSVTLTCSSDAKPPVQNYTWFKGTTSVGKGKAYIISKISTEHSGKYKCKCSNEVGHQDSISVTLNVLYPPKRVSVSISSSGEIVEGSSVTLTCSSDANPPVQTYTWYKVNESSPVGSGQSYSFTLRFNSSGLFYCVAQNKYGNQRAAAVPVTLNVTPSSDHSFSVMDLCVAVGVGICGVAALIAALFCMRRTRQKRNAVKHQDGGTGAEDSTYTSLKPLTRSSNDVYSTLATVHPRPPDNTYAALDPQSISSDYDTLTVEKKHR